MKVDCIHCGRALNLDHWIFEDYEGPVKCFSCSKMMEVKTAGGIAQSVAPLATVMNRRFSTWTETRG